MRRPTDVSRIALIAIVAYALNLLWEYGHYALYDCPIPRLSCALSAAFADTVIILALWGAMAFLINDSAWALNVRRGVVIGATGVLIAWLIELRAFSLDKWAYDDLMPIVPWMNVGLSPLLQMIVTPLLTFWIVQKLMRRG